MLQGFYTILNLAVVLFFSDLFWVFLITIFSINLALKNAKEKAF